jgi:hypothetical protein
MATALLFLCPRCHSQAALLMEEPYGFFGALNPTGHTAVYFQRICAETPIKLRRCRPGELGSVIARYQGVSGYDWVAMPLIPYLYSVEDASQVPTHVDKDAVNRIRNRYHETHLMSLGEDLPEGGLTRGGWKELVGVAYERRIYAFRFDTTEDQDDSFIARMNSAENRSRFQLLFSNCADFARVILNEYFPRTFDRSIFPDAGMTTPKQITYKLVRYARQHPETQLSVIGIDQVPGYRRLSRHNKSISESLITTAYAVPIAMLNPYLAGGLFVDYMVRGRYHLIPKSSETLSSDNLASLTTGGEPAQNPYSANAQVLGAAVNGYPAPLQAPTANPGLKEIGANHE